MSEKKVLQYIINIYLIEKKCVTINKKQSKKSNFEKLQTI